MRLPAIDLNQLQLVTTVTTSEEMASLLATSNWDKVEQNVTKVISDKAFAPMKKQVDEIRAAGKFLFW